MLNLTQHAATQDQIAAGVQDVADRDSLSRLLTVQIGGEDGFASLSQYTQGEFLRCLAWEVISRFVVPALAELTRNHFQGVADLGFQACLSTEAEERGPDLEPVAWDDSTALNARTLPRLPVMVGGFHPLMAVLVPKLREVGCDPFVALSDRVTEEVTQPDGMVKKTQVFKHLGFYPA